MSEVVCLYHDDCPDGVGAAWVVKQRYPQALCVGVNYRDALPEGLDDKRVVIVDFSYDLPEMRTLIEQARFVTLLDHHERSEALVKQLMVENCRGNFYGLFDANRSGCVLAWQHFFPERDCPALLRYIQDRDLWRFEYPESDKILRGLGMYPLELSTWEALLAPILTDRAGEQRLLKELSAAGEVIRTKNATDIDRIIRQSLRFIQFLDIPNVPIINVPRALVSEALAQLAQDHDLALGYYDSRTHREFSLRSRRNGGRVVNVLARAFGGDGHPHAAGFRLPLNRAEFALLSTSTQGPLPCSM